MNLLKRIYLREILSKEIELLILFSVLLFFPNKSSLTYYLFIAFLLVIFSLRFVFTERNLKVSKFSNIIIFINIFFIITSFFSNNIFDSLLLIADIIIVSIFIFMILTDYLDLHKLFYYLMLIISLFSLIKVLNDICFNKSLELMLFDNPIRIGIIAGLGFLISLFFILKERKRIYVLYIIINIIAVYLSESKGAFIGIVLISILIFFQRNKKMVFFVIILLVLTLIIPNPIKDMFRFSIYKDKYSTGRLDIWKMSFEVFKDYPLFGVGPNNFKNIAKRYNFKQLKGPANYSKVPKQTHSDYFKLIAENGFFGILIIFLLFFVLIRRIRKNKTLDIPELLLVFMLFQALFFNILFRPFFLFLFMLLLKIIFEEKTEFINITKNFKLIVSFALIFVFVTGHLLPYISNHYLEKSIKEKNNFLQKDKYLKKANYYMPINSTPLINRALLYFNAFTKTFNFDFCFSALDMIKRAKRLSPDNPEIYNLELQFYMYYYKPLIKLRTKSEKNRQIIDNILDELLTLINKIEEIAPNNPFLRFNKAKLLLEFDKKKQALVELQKAIEIEPDYLDALIMLNNKFAYFKDKTGYEKKIAKIKKKRKQLNPKQGSYLYKLFNQS